MGLDAAVAAAFRGGDGDGEVVGVDELLRVLCSEIARITGAQAVRVRLVEQPGQPASVTEHGRMRDATVELPMRVGARVYGVVELDLATSLSRAPIVHVDGLVSVAGVALAALAEMEAARTQARRDPLTGLLNRRAFDKDLRMRVAAGIDPLTLMLIDLDDLKQINGREGHGGGDDALCALGAALAACTRSGDGAYRIGGDEFALVLEVDAAGAADILVRVRADLAARARRNATTFSAGIATLDDTASSASRLFSAADSALFIAKRRKDGLVRAAPLVAAGHA